MGVTATTFAAAGAVTADIPPGRDRSAKGVDWPASGVALLDGRTYHARRDAPANAFVYRVDYVLVRMSPGRPRWPYGGGRFAPLSISHRDYGAGDADPLAWAEAAARSAGATTEDLAEAWLLTQPRRFGYVFNPVSFWLFRDAAGDVRVVLAEVNNTYGDRHAYVCRAEDGAALTADARIVRPKRMHVSPFQDVAGDYAFRFAFEGRRIAVRIEHRRDAGGMVATLDGLLQPLDARSALRLLTRRPFGGARTIGLIHWQALKLWLKGARFRARPTPPDTHVTG